jgi:hypothetical protein
MIEVIKNIVFIIVIAALIYGSLNFRLWAEFRRIDISKRRKAKMNALFGPSTLDKNNKSNVPNLVRSHR